MEMINTKKALMWLWVTLALIILFTLILFNQSYAGDSDYFDDLSYREKTIAKKMERKYLGRSESVLRFKGDARIDQDELVDGDIITLKGTLNIEGEVEGDALSVFGDVDLGSDAYVHGDVISVNGKVWTHDDARVGGDIVVTNVPLDDDDDDEHVTIQQRPRTPRKKEKWSDDSDEVVYADYTRVDGLTLGLQFPQPGWWANRNHSFALLGKGGYSFASKRWQYKVGLERWTHSDFRFTLGAEIHDMSDTEDRWIICDHENALAAFFIKEDFRDYYNRKGYSVYASQHLGRNVKLQASYHNDDFHNLKKRTNWSLFGKGKDFRDNPLALPYEYSAINGFDAPLNIKSVSATFTIDTRNHPKHPNKGWFINAFAEHAGDQMDNSIQFERYILDIAHYFPLSWDEHISMRLRGATSTGILPPMYWYDLGGISTLRGVKFKELTGDRLVLGNLEYHLRAGDGNFLGLDLILFIDSGLAWFADETMADIANRWPIDSEVQEAANKVRPEDTFENLTWASLHTNAGFALASPDGDFRVNFARRIDRGGQDIIVTFRLCRPF